MPMTPDADTNGLRAAEARAAAGQADAQYELGMSLLSGKAGIVDGARAGELLESASSKGHAQATATIASLEAMGTGRVQSWPRALDLLRLAAEQGSEAAQAQLLLLSDNDSDPVVPAGGPADQWGVLRAAIDIDRLVQAPERRSLSDDPRIRAVEGFATAAECRWLIRRATDQLQPALVFNPATGEFMRDQARSNTYVEFSMFNMDVATEVIRARISTVTKIPVPVFEPPQVLHYEVGQEFSPHYDFLDPSNEAYGGLIGYYGQRIATFLIYLNDEFEGGETQFPAIGLNYRGRTGDALMFANVDRANQPDLKTLHAGLPPTSGEKWIFSQWIRNQARGAGSDASHG